VICLCSALAGCLLQVCCTLVLPPLISALFSFYACALHTFVLLHLPNISPHRFIAAGG
jgi:hypothetical protein